VISEITQKCLSVIGCLLVIVYLLLFTALQAYAEDSFFDGKVSRVLEGNKIILRGGSVVEYAGIDVPRSRDENNIWFKDIATLALKLNTDFVTGKTVRLELVPHPMYDESDTTKYAYVFANGRMINAELLKSGVAVVSEENPPVEKYRAYFERLQAIAKIKKVGIWKKIS